MLVQSEAALAGLEVLLDGPPAPSNAYEVGQGDEVRGVAAVEGQFACAGVAAHE
jgi:hypothetical protein